MKEGRTSGIDLDDFGRGLDTVAFEELLSPSRVSVPMVRFAKVVNKPSLTGSRSIEQSLC